MLAHGNGDSEITSQNLVKTVRGEVPYDRIKGVDSSFTDRPINDIKTDIENDVIETLEEYEPRVDVNNVEIKSTSNGSVEILLNLDKVEEKDNNDE